MFKTQTKRKTINHILKDGKKQISEKILRTAFKNLQKSQQKSHHEIIKQTILNLIPIFRMIQLKKKKSVLEIPAFISSNTYRISWGLKYLIKTLKAKASSAAFYNQLQNFFLVSATSVNNTAKFKDDLQSSVLKKKLYFRYYRW